jgi:glutamine synthetase
MSGILTLHTLHEAVAEGTIDTVVVCSPDMQGPLVGKRFQAEYFLSSAQEETHGCDYLLANDMDMEPVPGYAAANWEKGYGDFVLKPDLSTLRRASWGRRHGANSRGWKPWDILRISSRNSNSTCSKRTTARSMPKDIGTSSPPAITSKITTSSRPARKKA